MTLIKKLKLIPYRISKYFKNKKFKEKLQNEKKKKYLFKWNNNSNKRLEYFQVFKKKVNFTSYIIKSWMDLSKFKFIYSWIGIFLILMFFYIVSISPYFRISASKLIIERLDTITDINMAYKSIEKVYTESIFTVNRKEVEDSLRSYQKNIKDVTISRLYPNWLKIIIKSYSPEFFTQFPSQNDKKYIITSNWILIYEKNIDKQLYNIDIIDNSLTEAWLFDYKEWIDSETMKKIIYTRDLFKEIFAWKNIAKLTYFKLENELHISLETWTKVIIELNDEISKQLAMLKYYNDNNNDTISTWELFYVDIRIIWKIYACKEKIACMNNLNRIYSNYYKK